MRIVNLCEDTCGNNSLIYEHGLSFYVETDTHRILVDTGASDAFIKNASALNIDLTAVDTVIISHGHYDHTGGLMPFFDINSKARVYIQNSATGEFYNASTAGGKYIGMDKRIADMPQVSFIQGDYKIDDELFLFTHITGRRMWPLGNRLLKELVETDMIQDEFVHEQYLVISSNNERILMSGCAHNGIVNIMDKYIDIFGNEPSKVFSGFHMIKKNGYDKYDEDMIIATGKELSKYNTVYYTGHCTGEYPLSLLEPVMKDKLIAIHSGMELIN